MLKKAEKWKASTIAAIIFVIVILLFSIFSMITAQIETQTDPNAISVTMPIP